MKPKLFALLFLFSLSTAATSEGSLWSNESSPKSDIKVGVRVHDVRLTLESGMLTRDELVGSPEFAKNLIMTVRQESVFPMSDDEFSFIQSLWNDVGETLIRKEFKEGSVRQIISKRYERNPKAKAECLKHFGYDCQGCGKKVEKETLSIGDDKKALSKEESAKVIEKAVP